MRAVRPPRSGYAVWPHEHRAADADPERPRGDRVQAVKVDRRGSAGRGRGRAPGTVVGSGEEGEPPSEQVERRRTAVLVDQPMMVEATPEVDPQLLARRAARAVDVG